VTDPIPKPAALRWQRAIITDMARRTPRIASVWLEPSEPFAFRPGQHVQIRLTAPDGYQAQRSYSIASAPEERCRIELAIERLDDGEVSPFFHDVARAGDDIELRGPIGGHFIWSVDDGGPLLLIGGGSGVVPLMSMLRHRSARGSQLPAALLLSARSWDELPFRDELLAYSREQPGFRASFAMTRGPAHRAGDHARRVDAAMIIDLLGGLPAPPTAVFVCGSNRFAEAASQAAIAAGIPARSIRTERYGS
jgi:ferredoxin-NADP reductase